MPDVPPDFSHVFKRLVKQYYWTYYASIAARVSEDSISNMYSQTFKRVMDMQLREKTRTTVFGQMEFKRGPAIDITKAFSGLESGYDSIFGSMASQAWILSMSSMSYLENRMKGREDLYEPITHYIRHCTFFALILDPFAYMRAIYSKTKLEPRSLETNDAREAIARMKKAELKVNIFDVKDRTTVYENSKKEAQLYGTVRNILELHDVLFQEGLRALDAIKEILRGIEASSNGLSQTLESYRGFRRFSYQDDSPSKWAISDKEFILVQVMNCKGRVFDAERELRFIAAINYWNDNLASSISVADYGYSSEQVAKIAVNTYKDLYEKKNDSNRIKMKGDKSLSDRIGELRENIKTYSIGCSQTFWRTYFPMEMLNNYPPNKFDTIIGSDPRDVIDAIMDVYGIKKRDPPGVIINDPRECVYTLVTGGDVYNIVTEDDVFDIEANKVYMNMIGGVDELSVKNYFNLSTFMSKRALIDELITKDNINFNSMKKFTLEETLNPVVFDGDDVVMREQSNTNPQNINPQDEKTQVINTLRKYLEKAKKGDFDLDNSLDEYMFTVRTFPLAHELLTKTARSRRKREMELDVELGSEDFDVRQPSQHFNMLAFDFTDEGDLDEIFCDAKHQDAISLASTVESFECSPAYVTMVMKLFKDKYNALYTGSIQYEENYIEDQDALICWALLSTLDESRTLAMIDFMHDHFYDLIDLNTHFIKAIVSYMCNADGFFEKGKEPLYRTRKVKMRHALARRHLLRLFTVMFMLAKGVIFHDLNQLKDIHYKGGNNNSIATNENKKIPDMFKSLLDLWNNRIFKDEKDKKIDFRSHKLLNLFRKAEMQVYKETQPDFNLVSDLLDEYVRAFGSIHGEETVVDVIDTLLDRYTAGEMTFHENNSGDENNPSDRNRIVQNWTYILDRVRVYERLIGAPWIYRIMDYYLRKNKETKILVFMTVRTPLIEKVLRMVNEDGAHAKERIDQFRSRILEKYYTTRGQSRVAVGLDWKPFNHITVYNPAQNYLQYHVWFANKQLTSTYGVFEMPPGTIRYNFVPQEVLLRDYLSNNTALVKGGYKKTMAESLLDIEYTSLKLLGRISLLLGAHKSSVLSIDIGAAAVEFLRQWAKSSYRVFIGKSMPELNTNYREELKEMTVWTEDQRKDVLYQMNDLYRLLRTRLLTVWEVLVKTYKGMNDWKRMAKMLDVLFHNISIGADMGAEFRNKYTDNRKNLDKMAKLITSKSVEARSAVKEFIRYETKSVLGYDPKTGQEQSSKNDNVEDYTIKSIVNPGKSSRNKSLRITPTRKVLNVVLAVAAMQTENQFTKRLLLYVDNDTEASSVVFLIQDHYEKSRNQYLRNLEELLGNKQI
jgi:hypothetical protein